MPLMTSLKHRAFLFLWIGQTISRLGDQVYAMALAWWILEKTHSATAMGTVLIVAFLPTLVFLLIAGICVWLMLSFRKRQRLAPGKARSQPQHAYPAYERGYEAEQPAAAISREAEQSYSSSEPTFQYEQPEAQYPQAASVEL